MDPSVHKCKSCGVIFDDDGQEIDKCAKKRLYCDLCLAQKNPRSETEQTIKRRYIRITALSAFIVLTVLIVINWEKNKNDTFLEYVVGFGFGYMLIWGFISILLIPALMLMKKSHKEQINKEKEKYIEKIEAKKESRITLQEEHERARTEEV